MVVGGHVPCHGGACGCLWTRVTPSRWPWLRGDMWQVVEVPMVVWGHMPRHRGNCLWFCGDTCHVMDMRGGVCPWLYGDTCHVVDTRGGVCPWLYGDMCHVMMVSMVIQGHMSCHEGVPGRMGTHPMSWSS